MTPFRRASHRTPEELWPEAMATVLSCTYTMRTGRALAFGIPSGKHFRIRYNYWVDGSLHEAEIFSAKPIPQGSVFPVQYDPDLPRNSTSPADSTRPGWPLLTFGLAGSLLLSLGWLLVLRGCS